MPRLSSSLGARKYSRRKTRSSFRLSGSARRAKPLTTCRAGRVGGLKLLDETIPPVHVVRPKGSPLTGGTGRAWASCLKGRCLGDDRCHDAHFAVTTGERRVVSGDGSPDGEQSLVNCGPTVEAYRCRSVPVGSNPVVKLWLPSPSTGENLSPRPMNANWMSGLALGFREKLRKSSFSWLVLRALCRGPSYTKRVRQPRFSWVRVPPYTQRGEHSTSAVRTARRSHRRKYTNRSCPRPPSPRSACPGAGTFYGTRPGVEYSRSAGAE